jgi:hypothetical protein
MHNECQQFLCIAQKGASIHPKRGLAFCLKRKSSIRGRTGLFRFLWGNNDGGGKPIGTAQSLILRNCEISYFAADIIVGTLREGSSEVAVALTPASRLTRAQVIEHQEGDLPASIRPSLGEGG